MCHSKKGEGTLNPRSFVKLLKILEIMQFLTCIKPPVW
nr:MAG TPA: hypothetical protein [Caudoviricetes sp.]